ncbi:MAG TPA: folate-binding protein [Jatrophihabitantaceae bacterium]
MSAPTTDADARTADPPRRGPDLDPGRAVPAEGIDAGVPWHYGDPLREQRVLTTAAGVIDQSHRDVVTVTGADRLGWLHSICSQHLSELADGQSVEALVLSPHGHVEQHWQLTELGEQVWIDTEPGAAPVVLDYLEKMRFLKRVQPQDVSDDWAVLALAGPSAQNVLEAAGLPVPGAGAALSIADAGFVRRVRPWTEASAPEFALVLPRAEAAQVAAKLRSAGAEPVGTWAYAALRIDQLRPRLGLETDHRTIPHEVGWIDTAVHLNKGCYRGQETVARVHNLGKPPRRLVRVHLSGMTDVLPEPGTPVESGGRTVGFVGTAMQHHELGPVALAVVKRNLPADASLSVAGEPVAIDAG